MKNINIYCGFERDTIVKVKPTIIQDIVFEIPCLECEGRGIWDYGLPEIPIEPCNVCKGTGRQYVGL